MASLNIIKKFNLKVIYYRLINYKSDFIYFFLNPNKKIFRLINITFKRQREDNKKALPIKYINIKGLFIKGSLIISILLLLPTPTPIFIFL